MCWKDVKNVSPMILRGPGLQQTLLPVTVTINETGLCSKRSQELVMTKASVNLSYTPLDILFVWHNFKLRYNIKNICSK